MELVRESEVMISEMSLLRIGGAVNLPRMGVDVKRTDGTVILVHQLARKLVWRNQSTQHNLRSRQMELRLRNLS